jgi:hypothetical protein
MIAVEITVIGGEDIYPLAHHLLCNLIGERRPVG